MKSFFSRIKHKITLKDSTSYRVDVNSGGNGEQIVQITNPTCDVIDLLANCNLNTADQETEAEYVEIEENMGLWHSTPLAHRHKSKISLTWVLKENLENKLPEKKIVEDRLATDVDRNLRHNQRFENERRKSREVKRVVGRNEYYHNLRFKSACEEFVNGDSSDTSVTEEYSRRKHRHRHRRKKKRSRFGYDIRDLDSFLTEATIDRPGNIPVVIAYPSTLYQTKTHAECEVPLPLGTVVNAVFKNQQWVYAQTPHGHEGYVLYAACLPLGILPNRTSPQKNPPCWESSTDIYPRPCGNLTDTEKEHLRGRTRSECRKRTRNCAEKNFDSLYLRTKSVCSIRDKDKEATISTDLRETKTKRQTLLVVNSDYQGSVLDRTLTVNKGEVVGMVHGVGETDVDAEWFYVKKKDGSQGFIPAAVAGHGYI